jgi:hypothetical protein
MLKRRVRIQPTLYHMLVCSGEGDLPRSKMSTSKANELEIQTWPTKQSQNEFIHLFHVFDFLPTAGACITRIDTITARCVKNKQLADQPSNNTYKHNTQPQMVSTKGPNIRDKKVQVDNVRNKCATQTSTILKYKQANNEIHKAAKMASSSSSTPA